MFIFKCSFCEEVHEGIPTFGWDYPPHYLDIPEGERAKCCELTSDTCVINKEWFFVRGCVEIHVHDEDQPFILGVWVSLSEKSFERYLELYDEEIREDEPPFFGWLVTFPRGYHTDLDIRTNVYLRNNGVRPFIDLEPTDYLLSVEQHEGISKERLVEICETLMHPESAELIDDET